MIPRYAPTFTAADLVGALLSRRNGANSLSAVLRQIYGCKHVFLFDKARTGLFLTLLAYNRPGEVILPAYTCIVVPEAVIAAGYIPRFVDAGRGWFNSSAAAIEKAICEKTTVIIPTHIFGIPCEIDRIAAIGRQKNILVFEDAAGAFGATYKGRLAGEYGDVSVVSFDRSKALGGWQGGALLTDNDGIAASIEDVIVRLHLREQGAASDFVKAGFFSLAMQESVYPFVYSIFRLLRGGDFWGNAPEMAKSGRRGLSGGLLARASSELIRPQVERYGEIIGKRQKIADQYTKNIDSVLIQKPRVPDGANPSWIMYPIRVENKKAVFRYMQGRGVDLNWNFNYSAAESCGFRGCGEAKKIAETVLGLPTHPSLPEEKTAHIVDCINGMRL